MSKEIIIMADIIKSREKQPSALMKTFVKVVQQTNIEFSYGLKSPLSITLGDEFQGVTKNISIAIRLIQYLEKLRIQNTLSYKMRYVVYEGEIQTKINSKTSYGMLGEGLTSARTALSSSKSNKTDRIFFFLDDKKNSRLLNELFSLYTFFADKWMQKDYKYINLLLNGHSYYEVAKLTKSNASVMWRKEKSLNIKSASSINNILYLLYD